MATVARPRRRWIGVTLLVLLLLIGGAASLSLRSHAIHQRHARELERDLMTYLPKVPGLRVVPGTLHHSVSGQSGGSSDCKADASVEVTSTMDPSDLSNFLNDTTPIFAKVKRVRPGLLLVSDSTPLGSVTWDWDC